VESKVHSALRPPMSYCASPGWLWWWRNRWNDWQGKLKYSDKTCPSAALSTTNPTCCPYENPGRRGGKAVSNRLSYGTAYNTRPVTFGSILLWPSHLRLHLGLPGGCTSGIPIKILYAFLLCLISYTHSRYQLPWFVYPSNIWWEIRIMKFLIMQISPLLNLRSKFSRQRPVLKHSQSIHVRILM
jgi:hypothetical protein